MRRSPQGMTNRGTPYTGWHRAMDFRFGKGWWKSKDLRREVAIASAAARGPRFAPGVAIGRIGVSFRVDASQLDKRIRHLPERMALTINARGCARPRRVAACVAGPVRASPHRLRPAAHRRPCGGRISRLPSRQAPAGVGRGRHPQGHGERKADRTCSQEHGGQRADERGTYAGLFGKNSKYFRELPGWRLHFLESAPTAAGGRARSTS